MTWDEIAILIVFAINFIAALAYWLWGTHVIIPARYKERREACEFLHDNRRTYLIRFLVMLLCPVVGPLFFLVSYLLYITIFRSPVDLEDVIFSKERVKIQVKADEERERNIVPIEEAVAANEKKDLRMAMMNVLKGEIQGSLASIALALNTEDSESSHYAASVLSDELNAFRINTQKMYQEIGKEEPEETGCEELLLNYMDNILKQGVFSGLEQKKYVRMMAEAAEIFYGKREDGLTEQQMESVCLRLLEINDFATSEKWCLRLAEKYPDRLSAYTCKLKLYFKSKNKADFFKTLSDLKQSDVVIDNETLELIRVFS